jgi:hypothetical protein
LPLFIDRPVETKPGQSRRSQLPQLSEVFVAMPFTTEFNGVFMAIDQASQRCGLKATRVDLTNECGEFSQIITESIVKSEIVIADMTNQNANVLLEIGIAIGSKSPHIIISQSFNDLPSILRNHHVIKYENSVAGLRTLSTAVEGKIEKLVESVMIASAE